MSLTRSTLTSFFTRKSRLCPITVFYYTTTRRSIARSKKVDEICINANSGFHKWSARSSEERRDIFIAAASIIEKNKQLYIDAHTEIGGPAAFAEFGVAGAVASCKEYAMHMTRPYGFSLQTQQTDFAITHQTPI
ncbi:hypothetical protein OXX80_013913, partial [Metschnikowia pulcherrima]